ncbi:MAG: hypothetical protein IBX55_22915 [Methyloprofundus sp.]|nr:hypothetical protein [Methyloprofundus sp.]
MKILLSGTNDFAKHFGGELQRFESTDPSKVGRISLTSTHEVQAWQCHLNPINYQSRRDRSAYDLIAVEANARFCLIFSHPVPRDRAEFERLFYDVWLDTMFSLSVAFQLSDKTNLLKSLEKFDQQFEGFEWVKNTDLSLNGVIADQFLYLETFYREHPPHKFDFEESLDFSHYFNQMPKRVIDPTTKKKLYILPFEEMAEFLTQNLITPLKHKPSAQKKPTHSNNIINFSDYKNRTK